MPDPKALPPEMVRRAETAMGAPPRHRGRFENHVSSQDAISAPEHPSLAFEAEEPGIGKRELSGYAAAVSFQTGPDYRLRPEKDEHPCEAEGGPW